jgi:hypothetical protein
MEALVNNELLYACDVRFEENRLVIALADSNEISVPMAWFPKLYYAMPRQLLKWKIVSRGMIIRWPDLDAEVSLNHFIN